MAVFVASTFFSFVAYAKDQNVDRAGVRRRGPGLRRDAAATRDRPFAEVPARIAAVPGVRSVLPIATAELLEDRPRPVWVVPCVDLAEQFGLAGRATAATAGQGALARLDETPVTRHVHAVPGPR